MKIRNLHPWNVTAREAKEIQNSLKKALRLERTIDPNKIQTIAGTDLSFCKTSNQLFAAVLVFNRADMSLITSSEALAKSTFPYIPGYLSFREAPLLIECLKKLKVTPDVLVVDGQGIAHPRRLGLACHIGLFADIPTIGCAKKRLIGSYKNPPVKKGTSSFLSDNGEIIGAVLRTRENVKPVFISPGHKIDLNDALSVILSSVSKFRLPVPTRQAHIHVNKMRKAFNLNIS